jgi:inner membrane protein
VAADSFILLRLVDSDVQTLGHVGAALLITTPFAAALAATSAPELAVLGLVVAVSVSSLPDVDQSLPIEHRGPTHTVWFVVGYAVVAAGVCWLVAPEVSGVVGTAVALSLTSHLLADSITPMGIRPLLPLSSREFCFDIVRAANQRANWLLFGAGLAVTALSQGAVALAF